MDPHKALNQPLGVSTVLIREGAALKTCMSASWVGDFIPQPDQDGYSPADFSFELSRPFRAFPLWFSLRLMGVKTFRTTLCEKLALAKLCYQELAKTPGVVMGFRSDLPIVTFRIEDGNRGVDINGLTNELYSELNKNATFALSTVTEDHLVYIRICINGYRTHKHHVTDCIRKVQKLSYKILKKDRRSRLCSII